MTINKRSKNSRQRASQTHGCGSMKKRRGAGHRGGRGMAGSGKRGDAKKPSIDINTYFGGNGFASKKKDPSTMNLLELQQKMPGFVNEGIAEKTGEMYSIDLGKIGVEKLLGSGRVEEKFKVKVKTASKKAAEKLSEAGCELETAEASEE